MSSLTGHEFSPGPAGMPAAKSSISFVDGQAGVLEYRGIPIEELAEQSSFLETSYLLLSDRLPTRAELDRFTTDSEAPAGDDSPKTGEAALRPIGQARTLFPLRIGRRSGPGWGRAVARQRRPRQRRLLLRCAVQSHGTRSRFLPMCVCHGTSERWLAHWLEDNKRFRPDQIYEGRRSRAYVSIDRRLENPSNPSRPER